MGFLDQVSAANTVQATFLLPDFQANCTLKIIGLLQTFVNDEQKDIFALHDAAVYGLRQGNPATSMRIPEMFVRKDNCHVIAFQQMFEAEHMGLMPRAERLAVYTSHYVIQGDFYMGTDALVSDFIHTARTPFIAATNVSFFPLFATQAAVLPQTQLAYVHRKAVWMHHAL